MPGGHATDVIASGRGRWAQVPCLLRARWRAGPSVVGGGMAGKVMKVRGRPRAAPSPSGRPNSGLELTWAPAQSSARSADACPAVRTARPARRPARALRPPRGIATVHSNIGAPGCGLRPAAPGHQMHASLPVSATRPGLTVPPARGVRSRGCVESATSCDVLFHKPASDIKALGSGTGSASRPRIPRFGCR